MDHSVAAVPQELALFSRSLHANIAYGPESWSRVQVTVAATPDFSVVGPDHPLQVTVVQDIVLPCHLSPSMEARSLDIRWIRHQASETVHHYRNGEDLYSEQLREYVGRTELVRDGLSSGRLDLRISGLRPCDDGQYICTVTDGASYGEATVDVEVAADFSVVGPDHSLQVTVGQDIVLPCHLSPSMDTQSLDIRWIRHQASETVHHYRNREDLYSEQLREYVGRTELVRDGLSSGRLDLRISGLRPCDDGQYVCTVTDGASYGEATVDVEVAADFSVVGPDHSLQVTVVQDIVLPCHLSPSMDTQSLDIRWIRHQASETVHHYRNREDLYSEQLREYVGRTELVRDGLSSGRLDLRISGLRPCDDGQYVCTVTDGASYGEATVDVEVAGDLARCLEALGLLEQRRVSGGE
ncbi:butyrophilin-like protein 2 [Grus americana]|uniref:butyrophilin-like protein 2 n=1 Tax=Grus americana TaxID=9117 RepID=UPI0024079959|nr:butyrophilin-like protein 2 [Grus americana]